MKIHTHPVGSLSVVVMDQHRGIHQHRADTPAELWEWMRSADPEAPEGTAFCVDEREWRQIVMELDTFASVHVETELDTDLVITRHLR